MTGFASPPPTPRARAGLESAGTSTTSSNTNSTSNSTSPSPTPPPRRRSSYPSSMARPTRSNFYYLIAPSFILHSLFVFDLGFFFFFFLFVGNWNFLNYRCIEEGRFVSLCISSLCGQRTGMMNSHHIALFPPHPFNNFEFWKLGCFFCLSIIFMEGLVFVNVLNA